MKKNPTNVVSFSVYLKNILQGNQNKLCHKNTIKPLKNTSKTPTQQIEPSPKNKNIK